MPFIVVVFLSMCFGLSHAQAFDSFAKAKKIASEVFAYHSVTLYCQCQYNNKRIDLGSCGMNKASEIKRAHKMEWEHMFPAHQFGQHLECWRKPLCERGGKSYKGRACCQKISERFRRMESELYNLWPAVGLVNGVRSNYRMSVVPGASTFYGCSIKFDTKSKRVEPPDNAKGIVARAHLFFSERYSIRLSPAQRKLFVAWDKMHPPTAWEHEWAIQIASIEGYENHYITRWNYNDTA